MGGAVGGAGGKAEAQAAGAGAAGGVRERGTGRGPKSSSSGSAAGGGGGSSTTKAPAMQNKRRLERNAREQKRWGFFRLALVWCRAFVRRKRGRTRWACQALRRGPPSVSTRTTLGHLHETHVSHWAHWIGRIFSSKHVLGLPVSCRRRASALVPPPRPPRPAQNAHSPKFHTQKNAGPSRSASASRTCDGC